MSKTILITGSTDGIGLEAAKSLAAAGHRGLLHGRNAGKLDAAREAVDAVATAAVETYRADLSRMHEVELLAQAVTRQHDRLDVLINNAGVFATPVTETEDGLDIRFAVNAIAPYLLTRRLLPLLGDAGRVVNLSSAAQATVDLAALAKAIPMGEMPAYAQSKLAITAWTRHLATEWGDDGPTIVAVNPGSLLATKMVKEAFGMPGNDIRIGSDLLVRAALSDEFSETSGQYFDNDARRFASPHADAMDSAKNAAIVATIERILKTLSVSG